MATALKIFPLLCLLLALPGCRTVGQMLEGQNSDRQHGGGCCRIPQEDADGELYVPHREWWAGPQRVW